MIQSQILMLFELAELEEYNRLFAWNNRVTGCFDLHSLGMGVMPMKNHYDFKDILTFGIFILALLTFVFTFCK